MTGYNSSAVITEESDQNSPDLNENWDRIGGGRGLAVNTVNLCSGGSFQSGKGSTLQQGNFRDWRNIRHGGGFNILFNQLKSPFSPALAFVGLVSVINIGMLTHGIQKIAETVIENADKHSC